MSETKDRFKIFYYFSIYEIFFQKISKKLKARHPHFRFGGILYGKNGLESLKPHPFDWDEIAVFSDYLRAEGINKPADMDFLSEREKDLGIPNLTMYIACDRSVSKLPHPQAVRILELNIRFIEKVFDSARPDLIMMDDVCCMMSYLIYKIGKKRGLPVWSIGTLKINDRISIYDDCLDQREKINRVYAGLQRDGLNADRRSKAELYRKDYVENFKPLTYLKYKAKTPVLSLEYLKKFFEVAVCCFRDPLDFRFFPFTELLVRRFKRVWNHFWSRKLGLFENPAAGEKYIFFPLQAQPERTTLVLAPFYMDQLALMEYIAKSLPIGFKLYVKEHPIFVGRRPVSEYQRMRKTFNIRLIRTEIPSQELVKNAAAVVTVSNTIGVEAILFERPLLVLGDTFYNFYRGLTFVDNLKDLPKKIQEVLSHWKPDREELYKFITALLEGSYLGTRRHPGVIPYVLTEENIQHVTAALEQEIRSQLPQAMSPQAALNSLSV